MDEDGRTLLFIFISDFVAIYFTRSLLTAAIHSHWSLSPGLLFCFPGVIPSTSLSTHPCTALTSQCSHPYCQYGFLLQENIWQMQLKGERVCFGSVAGDTVHHGKEDVAASARVTWSHCIRLQRKRNCSYSAHFLPFTHSRTSDHVVCF